MKFLFVCCTESVYWRRVVTTPLVSLKYDGGVNANRGLLYALTTHALSGPAGTALSARRQAAYSDQSRSEVIKLSLLRRC